MADSSQHTSSSNATKKHRRRRSLTQFIPKNNKIHNPLAKSTNTSANNSTTNATGPTLPRQASAFSPHGKNYANTFSSPHNHATNLPFGKPPLFTLTKTTSAFTKNDATDMHSKPDFQLRRKNKIPLPKSAINGYHTSPEQETSEQETEADTETDSEILPYDALKRNADTAAALYGGYLSDGVHMHVHKKIQRKKRKIKSYKRNIINKKRDSIKERPKRILTDMDEESTKKVIHESVDRFNRKKHKRKHHYKKKISSTIPKRHSVGHCDSSTLGMLKTRYALGLEPNGNRKSKKHLKQESGIKLHRATMVEEDKESLFSPVRLQIEKANNLNKRRRSLFKKGAPTPLDTEGGAFEDINSNKWDIQELTNVETEQEFYATLISHSKEDIIELCWDLLQSKDKSDELLRMVSIMNHDLEHEAAYDTMMETIKDTLDCKFASLYAIEQESQYLKCLWTTDGEPDKDIFIAKTSSTLLPARVWQKNQCLLRSVTENSQELCPDFIGFGNVYIMGVPIRDYSQNDAKIGVLMVYRDRWKMSPFDESDVSTAKMLTSICSTTLKNVSLFFAANEKEKRTHKILSMIDEMSGDVSEGYQNIIKKLVRKIRSLVACSYIDFWTVDLARNKMQCEVSDNGELQDLVISRDNTHILGQCALTGRYVKIDNTVMDTRYSRQQLSFCQNGESILVIPVRVESEVDPIAVIVAINKVPKLKSTKSSNHHHHKIKCIPFTQQDRRMLETFATSASIIIKNSLLFQKINGLNRKHESMVSILRALQEKHDVTHMLSFATLAVRDALEAERVSLWFEDGEGNLDALDIGDVDGLDEDIAAPTQAVFVAIARYCAEGKMLINTPNVFEDEELFNAIGDYIEITEIEKFNEEDWLLMNRRSCSVLCVPILSNESVVGVIQAIYKRTGTGTDVSIGFSDTDQQIVESVSSEVAHTIARNISDLTLQKYVDKHDDIPLDVIEYYLTGSLQPQSSSSQQRQGQPQSSSSQVYSSFILEDKLRSYCDLLPTCNFDVTQFEIEYDLESFVMYAMDHFFGFIKEFKLNCGKLSKFIHSIAQKYRSNPFHNWQHGFFVFHFVLYFIKKQRDIVNILCNKQLLAILIAAMCHDVDHPGNDNLYEIEADSDLARIYNGVSVLENHHAYTTLALLRKSDLNFFLGSKLNKKDVKDIKNIITKSIMSTDMSHHTETISWMNEFVSDKVITDILLANNAKVKEIKRNEIKLKLCQCIVHLGDLSAQTYPWRIAKEWERRIAKEFKQQTIKEEKLNIAVRDWMANTDLSIRYKNQFFFVTHVVKPLWEPAAMLFHEMEERLTTLKANSQRYIQIAKKKENHHHHHHD